MPDTLNSVPRCAFASLHIALTQPALKLESAPSSSERVPALDGIRGVAIICRRALRILPLYYTALILLLIVAPVLHLDPTQLHADAKQQLSLWLFDEDRCPNGEPEGQDPQAFVQRTPRFDANVHSSSITAARREATCHDREIIDGQYN
jgi:hypothetical protein